MKRSETPEPHFGSRANDHGLSRRMRQMAAELQREFRQLVALDPKRFKKQAVFHLKRFLPPGPGRPKEDAITLAIELRRQGHAWPVVYERCIPGRSRLS